VLVLLNTRKQCYHDTEGAFDISSFCVKTRAAERYGIRHTTYRWICFMLKGSNIVTTLSGETLWRSSARGYVITFAAKPGCG
jgi:hypothetical protein